MQSRCSRTQAEDPRVVSDSEAESGEERPGSCSQAARCAWVTPERRSLPSSRQCQQLLVVVDA